MPAASCFIDTNVLLYAISLDPLEAAKAAAAQQLLTTQSWAWSSQVAAEFIHSSTSSRRPKPLSLTQAEGWIAAWATFPMVAVDLATVKEAIAIARAFQIAYFDAQIVAAAKRHGCGVLYAEDLNHGQDYAGVRAINPFSVP